jgi:putative two-component system response regulator
MKDRPTILIVDDEVRNVELEKALLEPYNYKVLTALDGDEVLKAVAANSIDLILLDVMMPGKDGFEITRRLKSNEKTRIIPIILVTALSDKKDRIKGIEAGCDDFISKPVDVSEFVARVRTSLEVKSYSDDMHNHEIELENEVSKRTAELYTAMALIEEASLETIHRLAAIVEYRDEYTGSHITRMSRYAAAITQKMGLDDGLAKAMLYASPMHDIGKIGIPDRILLKPGKLDSDEWEIMKQHAVIGANILNGSKQDYMKLAEEIALTHHEKWNGRGYPQGLVGEDIPISGRIAAVADVFDALISERPYKPALSTGESFTIIEGECGRHFDPKVAEAFLDIKQEILTIVEQYKDSAQNIKHQFCFFQ